MITKEWLENEIRTLDDLEESAAARVAEAKRAQCRAKDELSRANDELLGARRELESLRGCKMDLIWQLANMGGKP